MTESKQTAVARHPRWDGGRVLFEVADGGRSVACTISVNALQDLDGHRRSKPADLLACFDRARAHRGDRAGQAADAEGRRDRAALRLVRRHRRPAPVRHARGGAGGGGAPDGLSSTEPGRTGHTE